MQKETKSEEDDDTEYKPKTLLDEALEDPNFVNSLNKIKKQKPIMKGQVSSKSNSRESPPPAPRNPDATEAFAGAIDYGHTHGTEVDNVHFDPRIHAA